MSCGQLLLIRLVTVTLMAGWNTGNIPEEVRQYGEGEKPPVTEQSPEPRQEQSPAFLAVFWNLENFFDWRDDGSSTSDSEFSSGGLRRWTSKRFYRKCNDVAKTLLWLADRYGKLPDVAGFAEVENSFVVKSIINATVLRKFGYNHIHFESPDTRGIDVALLYRPSVMDLRNARPVHIRDSTGILATRDILCASFERTVYGDNKERITILVNHHPSKYGGAEQSRKRRAAALNALRSAIDSAYKSAIDSLSAAHPEKSEEDSVIPDTIIAMGDFNDTPDNPEFQKLDGAAVNLALPLHARGLGTIRYEGRWELIDMFWVSGHVSADAQMHIATPPFLMTRDRRYAGEKPRRTYTGPRYNGGVSDHLPIVLTLMEKNCPG